MQSANVLKARLQVSHQLTDLSINSLSPRQTVNNTSKIDLAELEPVIMLLSDNCKDAEARQLEVNNRLVRNLEIYSNELQSVRRENERLQSRIDELEQQ